MLNYSVAELRVNRVAAKIRQNYETTNEFSINILTIHTQQLTWYQKNNLQLNTPINRIKLPYHFFSTLGLY